MPSEGRGILSPVRLPVPPLQQVYDSLEFTTVCARRTVAVPVAVLHGAVDCAKWVQLCNQLLFGGKRPRIPRITVAGQRRRPDPLEFNFRIRAAWPLFMRIFFKPIDDAATPSLMSATWKLMRSPSRLSASRKQSEKLLLVNWGEKFDGLHFNHHLIFHDRIGPKSGVDADVLVDHRDRLLPNRPETPGDRLRGWDAARVEGAGVSGSKMEWIAIGAGGEAAKGRALLQTNGCKATTLRSGSSLR